MIIDIRTREVMPGGWGFCFVFSTRGPEFCTEKLSPGRGFWRKKLVARRSAREGDGNRSNWYLHYVHNMKMRPKHKRKPNMMSISMSWNSIDDCQPISCKLLSYPILFYHILSNPILPYPILTYLILPYPTLSNPILPYPILSDPTLPYPTLSILSYPVLSYPTLPTLSYSTLSYPIVSYPILSCPTLSFPTLSYPTLPCPILPYPTLSYPILPYSILCT